MKKKKSEIEKESRVEVAKNKKLAEQAEIEAEREVQLSEQEAKEKVGRGYTVSRYKGLGEMDADQLWATTMDPKRRRLIQITMPDDITAGDKIDLFMGKDASRRKDWINENIDFSNKDDFTPVTNGKDGE